MIYFKKMQYKLKAFLITIILAFCLPLFASEQNTNVNSSKVSPLSLLFIPTKDSAVSTNTILKRIILAFSDEMPDVIVINGKSEMTDAEKRMFYDYTASKGEDYLILKRTDIKTNARIVPYSQNKDIDVAFLKDPTQYPQRRNSKDTESIVNDLNIQDEATILCLSLSERSPYDLSLWAEPSRNDVKAYWKTIDSLMTNGFYDAIENSRQNTSALGPIYSDWTYKSHADDEFRLDFLLLKNVAISDVYTMDLPILSDTTGIKRRALYAHLFVHNT